MSPSLQKLLLGVPLLLHTSQAASLADLCTIANVEAALPANESINGINFISSSTSAAALYNVSSTERGSTSSTSSTYSYCNITIEYTHTNKNDSVVVKYALPDPTSFKSRFYTAGGGGYLLSSSPTGGLPYGAASGATSAGYNAFSVSYDEVVLYGNGSINWDATHMFGYQALGEMTSIGKVLTKNFYSMSNSSKLFTYFQGCSDGGREGMSQVQRWGDLYDGVVAGAPAFRYAQQQVNHVFSSLVEYIQDYFPPPCELSKIVNATISACDGLDGRIDGVVSRTDLCQLHFNLSSIIGESYYCAATTSSSLGFGFSGGMRRRQAQGSTSSSTPVQNGTVSVEGVAVAQAIYNGLHNSKGQRAYLSWQIASELSDASTTYDNVTGSYILAIPSTGGEFVTKFVKLVDVDNLSSFEGVTYDTLVEWMDIAFTRYYDTLQTSKPDLSVFQQSGGKLLHYHGESDPSVPAASSIHYWQSVRSIMYPGSVRHNNISAMADWYQLYLVPGAAHCGSNTLQPGPYPQDSQLMDTIIDWVENGVRPSHLDATVSSGTYANETQQLCQWPSRPLWPSNSSTTFDCVFDKQSIDTWTYSFPAFKLPVY